MTPSQLDRYFARVGYTGAREPTLAVLHALTAAHTQSIPFENLDVLLGRGIELDDDVVFDKLVERERGGYCFEQNGLFLRVLTALGFAVTPLSARFRMDKPRGFIAPRTHVLLQVELDGADWLTDVGAGGVSLTSALLLEPYLEQVTPHDTRRIVREAGCWVQQMQVADSWVDVYELTGEPMPLIDRVVGNWYTSAYPQSHFKQRLLVARASDDGRRHTLLNAELKVRERDGRSEAITLESHEQLLRVLAQTFGLHFPPYADFASVGWPWSLDRSSPP